LIGSGSFGIVYQGFNTHTGELFAVKQICLLGDSATSSHEVEALQREVNILKSLSHPNIVQYYGSGVSQRGEYLNIFLEFVPGGSISCLLRKYGGFSEPVVANYTLQIVTGLEYLHKHQIVHRDIKGANLLVDNNGIVKLADFGASKRLEELVTTSSGPRSLKGTTNWMAPEVAAQKDSGRAADIWSVGCTVLEMLTGVPPWHPQEQLAIIYNLATTETGPPIPSYASDLLRDLLSSCFQVNSSKRPTATQLLQHEFLEAARSTPVRLSGSLMNLPLVVSLDGLDDPHQQYTGGMSNGASSPTGGPGEYSYEGPVAHSAPNPPSFIAAGSTGLSGGGGATSGLSSTMASLRRRLSISQRGEIDSHSTTDSASSLNGSGGSQNGDGYQSDSPTAGSSPSTPSEEMFTNPFAVMRHTAKSAHPQRHMESSHGHERPEPFMIHRSSHSASDLSGPGKQASALAPAQDGGGRRSRQRSSGSGGGSSGSSGSGSLSASIHYDARRRNSAATVLPPPPQGSSSRSRSRSNSRTSSLFGGKSKKRSEGKGYTSPTTSSRSGDRSLNSPSHQIYLRRQRHGDNLTY